MKWHVIYLVTIFLLVVSPIECASPLGTDRGAFCVSSVVTVPASHHSDSYLLLWVHWSAVVWAYGACPGRVALCRWKLTWRWGHSLSRKKRPTQKGRPVPANSRTSPAPASGKIVVQPAIDPEPSSEPPVAAEENSRVPLRMVLRPGVILTKQSIQLRPMIARLGEDVEEYRALWNDKERFEAATEHLLHCSCPLCGGESGFHRVGSDKRSVIPPGRKDREWFRIQKIECWDCEPGTRILPTFCVPFKSHHAQTIQNALEDSWRHNNTDNHHIFAVTVQDPESTVIWNILRVDRNDTKAFKQTLRQLEAVGIRLRAITTDGWPAIWRAVREELSNAIHLLCYFHAKKNVYETLEKYRKAKKLPANAPELAEWRRAFFQVLDAPTPKLYRTCLRKLTRRIADEPILLARCKSLQKKSHYNIWRLRNPSLAATSSMVELTFKLLTRKVESLYSFQRSKCNAAQKSLTVWALVRDFFPYLPGAKYAGQSPAQLAGIDLQGLPWLQYVNLKLSEVT